MPPEGSKEAGSRVEPGMTKEAMWRLLRQAQLLPHSDLLFARQASVPTPKKAGGVSPAGLLPFAAVGP